MHQCLKSIFWCWRRMRWGTSREGAFRYHGMREVRRIGTKLHCDSVGISRQDLGYDWIEIPSWELNWNLWLHFFVLTFFCLIQLLVQRFGVGVCSGSYTCTHFVSFMLCFERSFVFSFLRVFACLFVLSRFVLDAFICLFGVDCCTVQYICLSTFPRCSLIGGRGIIYLRKVVYLRHSRSLRYQSL